MSTFTTRLGVIVLLSAAGLAMGGLAMAAQQKAAAPHAAAPAARAAPHFSAPAARAAPHFSAPAAHAAPHFSARPSFSAARPAFRGNAGRVSSHANFRGNIARSSSHPVFRGASRRQGNVARTYAQPTFRGKTSRALAARNELNNAQLNKRALASSHAIQNALNTRSVRNALHNPNALRNPNTRSSIIASAAKAGWHHGDRNFEHGWWRHRHGGFGWVGPLFWPFAYYDFYNYALWGGGYDYSFWDYGYDDIYAGLFAPYGYDDLAGYLPQYADAGTSRTSRGRYATASSSGPSPTANQLGQMCGDDSRDIAGLPIDQVQQTLALSDQERAALDDLGNASAKAAQIIKAACPSDIALTAPARLAAMQARIDAMLQAVHVVQQPLAKFYGLLSDEQKARLNALGQDQSRSSNEAAGSVAQNCGATASATDWPTTEIERAVNPSQTQLARLDTLKTASSKAADMLKASCPDNNTALTPPARLAIVAKRLDTMQEAVKTVRTALAEFYNSLSDEQKAQFDAIGPQRAARG
jgi:hypothetical protein